MVVPSWQKGITTFLKSKIASPGSDKSCSESDESFEGPSNSNNDISLTSAPDVDTDSDSAE